MESGTIKKLNDNGFGFITRDGKPDLFFHASGMAEKNTFDNLQAGDRLTFDVDNTGARPRAINVRPADAQ